MKNRESVKDAALATMEFFLAVEFMVFTIAASLFTLFDEPRLLPIVAGSGIGLLGWGAVWFALGGRMEIRLP